MAIRKQDLQTQIDKAKSITDKLGMPIDPGILDLVVLLRAHGINTISSCEGHKGRLTEGPTVMFQSPLAIDITEKLSKEGGEISGKKAVEYEKAEKSNANQIDKVYRLLDKFYESRTVKYEKRIIVRCYRASFASILCQGSNLLIIRNGKEREVMLKQFQDEMNCFTQFLKDSIK